MNRRPSPADAPAQPASPGRRVAHDLLLASLAKAKPGMDLLLEAARKTERLHPIDAALAREIAWGVTRRRAWLMEVLGRYLERPLAPGAAGVREAILMGIYQHLYLDRIPAYTIVDESVRLAAASRTEKGFRGLANAVLRKVTATPREELRPDPDTPWRLRESIPDWIANEARRFLPEGEAEEFFAACNEHAPLVLRPVHRDGSPDRAALAQRLRAELAGIAEGASVADGTLVRDAFVIHGRHAAPDQIPAFQNGWLTAEDEGGQAVGHLCGVRPGMAVLDLCASPGGKAAHLADLAGRRLARFVACDISEQKLARMADTFARLGLREAMEAKLSSDLGDADQFDLVIVDAPCSGLGTLRRHPEIRWRRETSDVSAIAKSQLALLNLGARHVRPGGTLVYSVCAFAERETDQVCDKFILGRPGDFAAAPAPAGAAIDEVRLRAGVGRWRTWTHRDGCDAFFVARFRRKD